jgi:toxin-antitoxin system PIN domain toxin
MTDLLDVNVWLALADENHVHHEKAITYRCIQSASEIAFCRMTALALLRLSTHPKILSRPLSPEEAWDVYQRYRDEAQVGFILDSLGVDQGFMGYTRQSGFMHQLWTDCYLAALARFRNCRVVSFDRISTASQNWLFLTSVSNLPRSFRKRLAFNK